MGIEGNGERKADETRIRRLQKILGSKRASPTLSEVSKMRNDLEKLTEEVHAAKKLEAVSFKEEALSFKGALHRYEERYTSSVRFDPLTRLIISLVKGKANSKALLLKDLPGTQASTSSPNLRKSNASSRNIGQTKSHTINGCSSDVHNVEAQRKDVVIYTSPQHIQRTVAAVRGWLRESPTPRESTSKDQRHEDPLIHIPTSSLMSSIRNEAKLFSKHHKKANNLSRSESQSPSTQVESISEASASVKDTVPPAMRILQRRNMRMADLLGRFAFSLLFFSFVLFL
ncbi:uncharacterized protein LOC112343742 [Selaginella moellendorffii]|uniref:uncharacterized protein LOC112343742 n=1 Tax=Selaginella moellendorffii TaxID=88036 RepID=UPI000D1CD312|nr:uncharacterized protein LOC112343742 [Selaginella moellendorffii]|eukprot:XP_024523515.1 uncharacterized protein LOC112343742 [Selaginella moellendorffii]